MSNLQSEFDQLERDLQQLVALLEEAGATFWSRMLSRGMSKIQARELAGATYVLGCYGGIDTFSDFTISADQFDELQVRNLNARLNQLRTATFESAQAIAARRSW